jgi:hypothetical protein
VIIFFLSRWHFLVFRHHGGDMRGHAGFPLDLLNPDVALEIAQRALGGPIETIRQAVDLNYNYRQ